MDSDSSCLSKTAPLEVKRLFSDTTTGDEKMFAFRRLGQSYLELRSTAFTPSTQRVHRLAFRIFEDWIRENDMPMSRETLTRYSYWLLAKYTGSTPNHQLRYVKALLNWFLNQGWLTEAFWRNLPVKLPIDIVSPRRRRVTMTTQDFHRIINKAQAAGDGWGWYAIAIAWCTGLRVSDIETLQWGHIDMVNGVIRKTLVKTCRTHGAVATIPLVGPLKEIINTLAKQRTEGQEAVIPIKIRKLADRYGFQWHSIRRSFLTRLAQNGIGNPNTLALTGLTSHKTLSKYQKPTLNGIVNAMLAANKETI